MMPGLEVDSPMVAHDCRVQLTLSGLNHVVDRGTFQPQRSLQILPFKGEKPKVTIFVAFGFKPT